MKLTKFSAQLPQIQAQDYTVRIISAMIQLEKDMQFGMQDI